MTLRSRRALGFGMALIAGWSYVGCSASGNEPGVVSSAPKAGSNDSAELGGDGGDLQKPETGGSGDVSAINTDIDGAGAGGHADDTPTCAADVSKAELLPLDLYIMLDISSSMLQATSMYDDKGQPISKWTAVKTALEAFINDDSSKGIGVGIQYFPQLKADVPNSCSSNADCGSAAPCALHVCNVDQQICDTQNDCVKLLGGGNKCVPIGHCQNDPDPERLCFFVGEKDPYGNLSHCVDDNDNDLGPCLAITSSFCTYSAKCEVSSYATPAQEIAPLPQSAASLVESIETIQLVLHSSTPTGPALNGATNLAREWSKAHPGHQVATVLVTDGIPEDCTPISASEIARIASKALAQNPPINTFTIGVFTIQDEPQGKSILDKIALAGGTTKSYTINTSNDVALQLKQALDSIRNTRLACEYQIPEPKAGSTIDYKQINVTFQAKMKSSTLLYVASIENCDPLKGGWYYDTDPADGVPSKIEVCPTTCSTFQNASDASVDIAVGCETIVK